MFAGRLAFGNEMMNRLAVFCCLLVFADCCSADEAAVPTSKENFHLFLLIGQSNMAGRGKISKDDPPLDPKVLTLNQDNEWMMAKDPLHFDKPKLVGVGLGRSFAAQVRQANSDAVVGLIPCAVGGSSISAWVPGGYHSQTKSHPWDDMLVRLRAAMKVGTVKGILWHQGESDSKPAAAKTYQMRLHSLIERLRSEIGDETVPFIAGQLGQFKEKPWSEARKQVNSVHENLPEIVSNTAFVRSDGLDHKGDKTHFSAEAYRELGRRYGETYVEMEHAVVAASSQSR